MKRAKLIQQIVDLVLERELGEHADGARFLEPLLERFQVDRVRLDAARLGRRLQHSAPNPGHRRAVDDQLVNLMPMGEPHFRMLDQPAREDLDDRRPGSPSDVKARN